MTWARLDDAFWRNPKISALMDSPKGPEAVALHVAAISFCADRLTDGVVEKSDLRLLVRWHNRRVHTSVNLLVHTGVWSEVEADQKWQLHDYLEYNPSRADVLARRANDLTRQRRKRRKPWGVTA